jgi:hypothetical protein
LASIGIGGPALAKSVLNKIIQTQKYGGAIKPVGAIAIDSVTRG